GGARRPTNRAGRGNSRRKSRHSRWTCPPMNRRAIMPLQHQRVQGSGVAGMPSGVQIRAYGEADLPALRRMVQGLQEAECAMDPSRAHWADGGAAYAGWVMEEVAANSGAVFMAETEDRTAIGMVTCWRAEDPTDITVTAKWRTHLYVSDIFVMETWRGQ